MICRRRGSNVASYLLLALAAGATARLPLPGFSSGVAPVELLSRRDDDHSDDATAALAKEEGQGGSLIWERPFRKRPPKAQGCTLLVAVPSENLVLAELSRAIRFLRISPGGEVAIEASVDAQVFAFFFELFDIMFGIWYRMRRGLR